MPDGSPGGLRLAALLAPLSLVTDLAMGSPDESAMRACLLATGLARRCGRSDADVAAVYYTSLLQHLGCTATAAEEAMHLGGDELAARPLLFRTDEGRPTEMLALLAGIGAGSGAAGRLRAIAGMLTGNRWGPQVQRAVCEVATLMAARLGLSPTVQEAVPQTFERWDGKGLPGGRAGEAISPAARFTQVAARALAYHAVGGVDAAIDSVRRSAGGALDPDLAAAFATHGAELLQEIEDADVLPAVLDAEPQPHLQIAERAIDGVAAAFADMADLKSTFTIGHSPGVAALAQGAAERLGLDGDECRTLRLAALLHDLGRVGVPASIWERAGQLRAADWERVRLHPYYTERILARTPALAGASSIAALHHERLDGSGYHRGVRSRDVPVAARILATADALEAMTHARAHRPAMRLEAAAEALAEDARAGRLDADAVRAVLDAAGAAAPRVARELPAGLSERELEVLRLIAAGSSNQEIADRLVISRRTAEHHVQHIYDKIGLSTRAGASMFAMQHELLVPEATAAR